VWIEQNAKAKEYGYRDGEQAHPLKLLNCWRDV
jgi:hypothetical protein